MELQNCPYFLKVDPNFYIANKDKINKEYILKNKITHIIQISPENDFNKQINNMFNSQKDNYLLLENINESNQQNLTDSIDKVYSFLDTILDQKDDRIIVNEETNVGIIIVNKYNSQVAVLLVKTKSNENKNKWIFPIKKIKEKGIVDDQVVDIFKKITQQDFPDYELYNQYDYSYHEFRDRGQNYNILQINIENNKDFNEQYFKKIDISDNYYLELNWHKLDEAQLKYDMEPNNFRILKICLENMKLKLSNQNASIVEFDYNQNNEEQNKPKEVNKDLVDNTNNEEQNKPKEVNKDLVDSENNEEQNKPKEVNESLVDNSNNEEQNKPKEMNKDLVDSENNEEKNKPKEVNESLVSNKINENQVENKLKNEKINSPVNTFLGLKNISNKIGGFNVNNTERNETNILFIDFKTFNISLSLLASYLIISKNSKLEEFKQKVIEKNKCQNLFTNTYYNQQLINLQKIIQISQKKLKKTLKKKRGVGFKKSLKKAKISPSIITANRIQKH